MEPIESRSDSRHRVLSATPAEVFAAMRDPARVEKWCGPAGFTHTIHQFDFTPGGNWRLTMHGPDGQHYPNASRFTRIVPDQLFEIEHLNGHHFVLTIGGRSTLHRLRVRRSMLPSMSWPHLSGCSRLYATRRFVLHIDATQH